MRLTLVSAAEVLALLCPLSVVPAAAFADPPHFLSDNFAPPAAPPMVSAKKPLYGNPNNHLERIPKCTLYFDYRQPGPERVVVYRYHSPPKVAASSSSTKRSALP